MKTIETARLRLRQLTARQLADALDRLERLESVLDVRLSRDIFTEVLIRALTMKLSRMALVPRREHQWLTYWLIIIRDEQFGAGMIGFKGAPDSTGAVEVGYGIDPASQNQGYMTEALRAMIDWAFNQPDCRTVFAETVINPASMHVLAKCGFRIVRNENDSQDWRLDRE